MWEALIKLIEKWACCHEWEYVGTEIHKGYKGPVKYKKYVCKNCGKIKEITIL